MYRLSQVKRFISYLSIYLSIIYHLIYHQHLSSMYHLPSMSSILSISLSILSIIYLICHLSSSINHLIRIYLSIIYLSINYILFEVLHHSFPSFLSIWSVENVVSDSSQRKSRALPKTTSGFQLRFIKKYWQGKTILVRIWRVNIFTYLWSNILMDN